MKTMILDNNMSNIRLYDESGIDRIFIDLEILGKVERQGGLDTVISGHCIDDIVNIKPLLKNSELLVRINPISSNSESEITQVIESGADIVMLPMFKTVKEVKLFIKYVNKKSIVSLLLETSEALCRIDDILEVKGIDEIHIGLNDLRLALGLDFMFEFMASDLLEFITNKIKSKNIPFGVGGVARMDQGLLKGEVIMKEHVRLGSSMVILSRTFKGCGELRIKNIKKELSCLHDVISDAKKLKQHELLENKILLKKLTKKIAQTISCH